MFHAAKDLYSRIFHHQQRRLDKLDDRIIDLVWDLSRDPKIIDDDFSDEAFVETVLNDIGSDRAGLSDDELRARIFETEEKLAEFWLGMTITTKRDDGSEEILVVDPDTLELVDKANGSD